MRVPLILTSLLLVAGCGSAPPAPAPTPVPTGPSEFQSKVLALAPAGQNIVFIRAIRDAGKDCQGVKSSKREADMPGGLLYFVANCTDGMPYGIVIEREGTAKVISRN